MNRNETIVGLRASRQASMDAADAILAGSKDASMSDEQTLEINKHLDAADAFGKQIEAEALKEAAATAAVGRLETMKRQPANPQLANAVRSGSGINPMPQGAIAARWTVPATARKALSNLTAFSDEREAGGFSREEKAYRFGQFALAKASRDLPSIYNFRDATRFCHEQGLLRNSHFEGGSDTSGSHIFVPEEFGSDMIKLREEFGAARKLCKMVPMSSDTRTDPRWVSGLTSSFTGEGSAASESSMVHQTVRLTAKKMTCLSTYSSELDEDSVMDFAQTLQTEMAYSDALKEDQCLVDGDGTSTYGGIRGLKSQFATTTIGTAPGYRDATGTTWGAITLTDVITLISVVPVYAQAGMQFLCSSQFYYQVMVPLLNAAGGVTGTELQNGFRKPMFQGIPVMFSQVMPIVTATSGIMVMLGRFDLSTSFGDRRRQTIEFSREATIGSTNLFESDLVAVKSSQRIDINVHSIGSNSEAGPVVALATA